jgi:uncharacterized repeat protein (TIGR03803 family)
MGGKIMIRSQFVLAVLLAVSLAAAPAAASSFTVLYSFTGAVDGADPGGPLLLDASGNLYGTATGGGRGEGTVFQLSPAASSPWTLTVLYSFPNKPQVGQVNPGLATDAKGALYGSTYAYDGGFAFRLAPPRTMGAPWHFSNLATFPGINSPLGGGASGTLSVDPDGTVTGVTQYGGDQSGQYPCQCGVIYRLPASHNPRSEHVLYTFTPIPDGNVPVAGLTSAGPDLFYGTTWIGGTGQCLDGSDVVVVGCGTVFELARAGAHWSETILYSFRLNEGNEPTDPVAVGLDGALYGFATLDVYRVARHANGSWHKQTIYSFPGGITGTAPTGAPIFDSSGNMYGATRSFGVDGPATLFKLAPPAAPGQPWTETTLATLPGGYGQAQDLDGLTRGPDGTLYGAARSYPPGTGYIFALSP